MRLYFLYLVVTVLAASAYSNWFRALCGAILLMSVIMHPDMPSGMFGVPGLNPWNILLVVIVIAWILERRAQRRSWDMPGSVSGLLVLYAVVVLVGFVRMVVDPAYLQGYPVIAMVSEELINTGKWVIPGLLLFDGCRTMSRTRIALVCTLGVYLLLAIQVIRWMPASAALSAGELTARSRKIILNEIGYHPVNMSMMLSGAFWAYMATLCWIKRKSGKLLVIVAGGLSLYAVGLTAGRMGYATWAAVGLVMCAMRWRRYIVLLPVGALIIGMILPGAVDRMLEGFGVTNASGERYADDYSITSGRTLIWPGVIAKIGESPIIGYGRRGMDRTGLASYMMSQFGESFPHPHNAYLQWLLDNGLIGLLAIMPFYGIVLYQSGRMFMSRREPAAVAVGGTCFAMTLALLVASMGSQSFYPREGAVGMWCAFGLMFRYRVESRARDHAVALRGMGDDADDRKMPPPSRRPRAMAGVGG